MPESGEVARPTVAGRIGDATRSTAVLFIDWVTIATETLRVVATKLDETADSLKEGLKP